VKASEPVLITLIENVFMLVYISLV
jgi:hypothetical protein